MLEKSTIERFAEVLRGRLVQPEDSDYDEVRAVWNGMIDRRPLMIARCTGTADVISSVNFAREQGLRVSVRGGGHSVAGTSVCEGGLMIDLSLMNSVRVDPSARTARVGAGARLGDLDHETQAFGLAVPAGIVSETGVAGLTLGGGLGYLARRHGLTIDNLISADVVMASGELLHASETENPDLFWGLRGGGGNFGVVTSFKYRLHEVGPELMMAQAFYPMEDARDVLHFFRKFAAEASDELACYAFAAQVPPVPPFPEEFQGKTAIILLACHSGTIEEGQKALECLNEFGNPVLKVVQPVPFKALQKSFDSGMPDGKRYYWKAQYLAELTDEAIDIFVGLTNSVPGSFSLVGFEPLGGAISRVTAGATAFPQRHAAFALGIWSGWEDESEDDEVIAWTRSLHDAMKPYSSGGVYANYLDQDDVGRVRSAFGENFERLQEVKARYDPQNFFRLNNNIPPKA